MTEFIEIINPARYSEVVGRAPISSEAEVERALASAQTAYDPWARTKPEARAQCLRDAARALREVQGELADLLVRENGKPIREAERDIARSVELMDIVATELPDWSKPVLVESSQPVWARRRPRGVTAVISPWNSPVLLSLKRVVPAIATGNTAIVKPATQCPLTILRSVEIMSRHFPAGVLSAVMGSGSQVGEKLAGDDRVRAIAFTGSTETGRRIMELAARTVKKTFLELGGNDAAVVLADAMLDSQAIGRMTTAILRAAGQVCIAIKRIYVNKSRFDELVEKLSESFDRMVVGDGGMPETTMGPINNRAQFDFVNSLIEECERKGLTVLSMGRKLSPEGWNSGFFVLPAIVLGAGPQDVIVRCEQFGPVVPIMPVNDDDEAVTLANDTEYGLRASVWTRGIERAQALADQLEAGAVFFNNHGIFQDLRIDFPGVKQSGFSRESRCAAMDHYADTYGFAC